MLCEKLAELWKEETITLSFKKCRATFAGGQGSPAYGCHCVFTSLKAKQSAEADRFA